MHLKRLELNGFKSFAKKSEFVFDVPIIAIVGPNGSGKSNIVEAIRFVLGEQSVKSMRGKTGSDLIFKGSKNISKMSRASVTITFDNSDRVFSIGQENDTNISVDFDEVSLSREVFSDGASVYKINGTEVRMKDIHELIASINIGASGHHIISQGEADRYLNANLRDRRTLIEEALGLKVYQYRLKESMRKLEKAKENIRESELLRREITPHLKFLKRQVEKIEKVKHLRVDLQKDYETYFQMEDFLINEHESKIKNERDEMDTQLKLVDDFLNNNSPDSTTKTVQENRLEQLEVKKIELSSQMQKLSGESGRLDGMISVLCTPKVDTETRTYSHSQITSFTDEIIDEINKTDSKNSDLVSNFFLNLKKRIELLLNKKVESVNESEEKINEIKSKKTAILSQMEDLKKESLKIDSSVKELKNIIDLALVEKQESQKKYYEFLSKKNEIKTHNSLLHEKLQSLEHRKDDRNREYSEALALLGLTEIVYQQQNLETFSGVTADSQGLLRREIERNKIRIEDMGAGSGEETISEYNETLQRDQFLEKEIHDVTLTIDSLHEIVSNIKETLNNEFDSGVNKINVKFDKFFKLMFGGGTATLKESLIDKKKKSSANTDLEIFDDQNEEGESNNSTKEYGIDISVELPRKKVTDLEMLSGGERSLTSIALLFALSAVNPPPFMVLDETDAALDEANSQKYGNMIESLSELSQLVVVTHNRETMSRAQTLFGVTLGKNDDSTMLSLRLEDAEVYAK